MGEETTMAMVFSVVGSRLGFLGVGVLQIAYVYYFLLRLRKGVPRLLAVLPLLPAYFLLPWVAPTAPERILLSFVFLWMTMFKLLMLVWGLGPGADPSVTSSFPLFLSAMTLSLHVSRDPPAEVVKQDQKSNGEHANGIRKSDDEHTDGIRKSESEGGVVHRKTGGASTTVNGDSSLLLVEGVVEKPSKGKGKSRFLRFTETVTTSLSWKIVLLRSIFYFLLDASWLHMILTWKPVMSTYVFHWTLLWLMYFSMLFLFEGAAAIPASILKTKLHPQFNQPYLSTSLADFWGRRWNLLVNNMLRVSVYEPTLYFLSGGMKKHYSPLNRGISTLAVFLVSGLEHELIFFYMNKTKPTWELTTFFMLNGLGVVAEGYIKPAKLGVPMLLRRAYTLSFLFFTSSWFFFPPITRTGMVDQCLADLQVFVDWLQSLLVG